MTKRVINFNSHPRLKVSALADILFQQSSKLIPFHFVSHSKLYNETKRVTISK